MKGQRSHLAHSGHHASVSALCQKQTLITLRYVNLWGAGQQIKGEEDANQVWGVVTRGACAIDIDCSKREFCFFGR
ncbi:hypothetical protein DM877_08000 [Enterobacter cloacae]|uniref:Uncharacterized protein n=1 Tax=Enterobacter cloacae TaxID=550 RepID=A0A4Q2E9H1_ENTCL|nr:hypothetical protein DM877_08000 [Enterobacter cloacae]